MATKIATFEFPADAWDGIVNAFCHERYQETIDGESNPQSREEFATERIQDYIGEVFQGYVVLTQTEQARMQATAYAQNRIAEVKAATSVTVIEAS